MEHTIVVIPSLEPDEKLLGLLASIREKEPDLPIVIVNDGSSLDYAEFFAAAEAEYSCYILQHKENKGKGAALKTAFHYILKERPEIQYVATIDSDGQHSFADMANCVLAAQANPTAIVLGTRDFSQNIPLRSKLGNIMTRNLLKILTGLRIDDTQTGLRVLPVAYLPALLQLPGAGFEYETKMLMEAEKQKWSLFSQPISTTYIEGNASSHFRVVADSFAIYAIFLKYLLSSLASFAVDVGAYALFIHFLSRINLRSIMFASLLARLLSALFNYYVNRKLVFSQSSRNSFLQYAGLVVVQILLSAFLVYAAHLLFHAGDTVLVKVLVDSLLFFLSYFVQKKYIFREETAKKI